MISNFQNKKGRSFGARRRKASSSPRGQLYIKEIVLDLTTFHIKASTYFPAICWDSLEDAYDIANEKFGLLFISQCLIDLEKPTDKKDKKKSELIDWLVEICDQNEYELERQQGYVYGLSETTNPHTSQYEIAPETPKWVWDVVYGYKSR
jgi:hypothetical protein